MERFAASRFNAAVRRDATETTQAKMTQRNPGRAETNRALNAVRRANLRGQLLCVKSDELVRLEWEGRVQWIDGGPQSPGGWWAVPVDAFAFSPSDAVRSSQA